MMMMLLELLLLLLLMLVMMMIASPLCHLTYGEAERHEGGHPNSFHLQNSIKASSLPGFCKIETRTRNCSLMSGICTTDLLCSPD